MFYFIKGIKISDISEPRDPVLIYELLNVKLFEEFPEVGLRIIFEPWNYFFFVAIYYRNP